MTQRRVGVLLIVLALGIAAIGLLRWPDTHAERRGQVGQNDLLELEARGKSPLVSSTPETSAGRAVVVWAGAGVVFLIGVALVSEPRRRRQP